MYRLTNVNDKWYGAEILSVEKDWKNIEDLTYENTVLLCKNKKTGADILSISEKDIIELKPSDP